MLSSRLILLSLLFAQTYQCLGSGPGEKGIGEKCRHHTECKFLGLLKGLFCTKGRCSKIRTFTLGTKKNGESCNPAKIECRDLPCKYGKCGGCESQSECSTSKFCGNRNYCEDCYGYGQTCEGNFQCKPPMKCHRNILKCGACETTSDCHSDEFCNSNLMCEKRHKLGERCQNNNQCMGKLQCGHKNKCGGCVTSENCSEDDYCFLPTNLCQTRIGRFRLCSSDRDCNKELVCRQIQLPDLKKCVEDCQQSKCIKYPYDESFCHPILKYCSYLIKARNAKCEFSEECSKSDKMFPFECILKKCGIPCKTHTNCPSQEYCEIQDPLDQRTCQKFHSFDEVCTYSYQCRKDEKCVNKKNKRCDNTGNFGCSCRDKSFNYIAATSHTKVNLMSSRMILTIFGSALFVFLIFCVGCIKYSRMSQSRRKNESAAIVSTNIATDTTHTLKPAIQLTHQKHGARFVRPVQDAGNYLYIPSSDSNTITTQQNIVFVGGTEILSEDCTDLPIAEIIG